jgi:hypothetical protein
MDNSSSSFQDLLVSENPATDFCFLRQLGVDFSLLLWSQFLLLLPTFLGQIRSKFFLPFQRIMVLSTFTDDLSRLGAQYVDKCDSLRGSRNCDIVGPKILYSRNIKIAFELGDDSRNKAIRRDEGKIRRSIPSGNSSLGNFPSEVILTEASIKRSRFTH